MTPPLRLSSGGGSLPTRTSDFFLPDDLENAGGREGTLSRHRTELEKGIGMSIKRNLLTAAATLTIATGVFTVGTPSASAATPTCGPGCISIFSRELGAYGQPNVVEAVLGGVAKVGQPVILAPASSSDPS